MYRFPTKRALENILLPASVAFGLVHAWVGRYSMNPDGVSYLDMGDALVRRDWAHAVNGYWSPLYGWMLGLVVGEVAAFPALGISAGARCELCDFPGRAALFPFFPA